MQKHCQNKKNDAMQDNTGKWEQQLLSPPLTLLHNLVVFTSSFFLHEHSLSQQQDEVNDDMGSLLQGAF